MLSQLSEVPVYSTRKTEVAAINFNHAKLTLLRLNDVIRFSLPNFQHIDVIIDRDSWACVDSSLNDMPMVAWLDFSVKRRDNLHQPIPCTLNYYHFMAGVIAKDALVSINDQLKSQLEELAHRQEQVTEIRQNRAKRKHLTIV